jgi:hypothetical protein
MNMVQRVVRAMYPLYPLLASPPGDRLHGQSVTFQSHASKVMTTLTNRTEDVIHAAVDGLSQSAQRSITATVDGNYTSSLLLLPF